MNKVHLSRLASDNLTVAKVFILKDTPDKTGDFARILREKGGSDAIDAKSIEVLLAALAHTTDDVAQRRFCNVFRALTGCDMDEWLDACLAETDVASGALLDLSSFDTADYYSIKVTVTVETSDGQYYGHTASALEWFADWLKCDKAEFCPPDNAVMVNAKISAKCYPMFECGCDYRDKRFDFDKDGNATPMTFGSFMEALRPYATYASFNRDKMKLCWIDDYSGENGPRKPYFHIGPMAAEAYKPYFSGKKKSHPCDCVCPICGLPLIPDVNDENPSCVNANNHAAIEAIFLRQIVDVRQINGKPMFQLIGVVFPPANKTTPIEYHLYRYETEKEVSLDEIIGEAREYAGDDLGAAVNFYTAAHLRELNGKQEEHSEEQLFYRIVQIGNGKFPESISDVTEDTPDGVYFLS